MNIEFENFVWDANKDASNEEKHGLDFQSAATIFHGLVLTTVDDRKDYGEVREKSTGLMADEVVIVVVHTDRSGRMRIISARKADRDERKEYFRWVEEA